MADPFQSVTAIIIAINVNIDKIIYVRHINQSITAINIAIKLNIDNIKYVRYINE
jgi:hypothetical protein